MEKVKFEELSLSTEMQRAITEIGYEEASPIQSEAIPALLAGRDVIGQKFTKSSRSCAERGHSQMRVQRYDFIS